MVLSIKEIKKRIDKLEILNEEIEKFDGFAIKIIRLTVVKYLCRDKLAMCSYALELAKKTKPRIRYKDNEQDIKRTINLSLKLMNSIVKQSEEQRNLVIHEDNKKQIRDLLSNFWNYQNERKKVHWSSVRIIENWQILIFEDALNCFKYFDDPKKGYELTRSYTEKYNPSFGTGLIPDSKELLFDVTEYWKKYYTNLLDGNKKNR
jgi:hypothetical protein